MENIVSRIYPGEIIILISFYKKLILRKIFANIRKWDFFTATYLANIRSTKTLYPGSSQTLVFANIWITTVIITIQKNHAESLLMGL